MFDVIVIGAGASGLMAAVTAAESNATVLLLEQKDRIGKKLRATGNGKCNFTNKDMDISHFRGDRRLAETVIGRFGKDDCLRFFHNLGIYPKEKNGYVYPNSEQAVSVCDAFSYRIEQEKNIRLVTSAKVLCIKPQNNGFCVETEEKARYEGRSVILAGGLLAAPKLGSDGSLFTAIKELGHRFSPIVPALCGFYCKGADFNKISGVRVAAKVTIFVDGQETASDTGEVQFTDYGISGIPVFQVSRFASMALYHKADVTASLSFLPDFTKEDLENELSFRRAKVGADADVNRLCNGLLPQKLALELARKANGDARRLAELITNFTVTVVRPRDYEFAQVCAGGIRSEEIDCETLSSKLVPGLYFAGELLDVDGICGGYNLQWAWASGYTAGKSAAGWAGKYD